MNDNFRIIFLFCLLVFFSCKNKPSNTVNEESTSPASTTEALTSEIKDTSLVHTDTTANKIDSIDISASVSTPIELEDSIKKEPSKSSKPEAPNNEPKPKSENKSEITTSKSKGSAEIKFEVDLYDFGEIRSGDEFDYKFHFTNTGKTALTIHGASATCGCTVPSYPFIPIMPGEKGYIGIHYNSVGKEGFQKATITVSSNARNEPVKKLYLKGNVLDKASAEEESASKDTFRF